MTATGITPADIGLEIRLGVSRENYRTKARRYLIEGRVRVESANPNSVKAFVTGTEEVHLVESMPGRGWSCSCPARGRCTHLEAVQLVTVQARKEDA